MRNYKKIPIWENRKRVKTLYAFKDTVARYFGIGAFHESNIRENRDNLRTQINKNSNKVNEIINMTGNRPSVSGVIPITGIKFNLCLLENIFHLDPFDIHPNKVTDMLDQIIGIYEDDSNNAILRTINPFFWIGLIMDYILQLPFAFIGKIGFNRTNVESSLTGKVIKVITWFITVGAAITTILGGLGYLDNIKNAVKALLK